MPYFIDQLNRTIELASPPKRIISLVPSQTELLFDLGLNEEVVGITKFCVHPAKLAKGKTKIGGTKKFNFERIAELRPDLIIANKEENYQEGIEYLAGKYPVWISDIVDWQSALNMIAQVGELACRTKEAQVLLEQIQVKQAFLASQSRQETSKVLYLIWREPFMAAGKATFINTMLELAGFENVCASVSRYPELTSQDIEAMQPDVIFLSSEPYPFRHKHILELQQICPQSEVRLVDGEMFSWYGSRLLKGLAYCSDL